MAFPTTPINGQEYKTYRYNESKSAWEKLKVKSHWAYKSAPAAFISSGINSWHTGGGEGDSLDATSNSQGIIILKAGLYEVRGVQRANGQANTYIQMGLNGNRAALETKANSLWNHDHATANGNYTETNFVGYLSPGDIITVGPPTSALAALLAYNNHSYSGSIKIKRLK